MSLDSNSYSLWQTLHSDCKTLPVMLTVLCLILSLDSPTLPSLSIHSHTFPACSSLIGPDSLKAPQLETSGGAVNYWVDILSSACAACPCAYVFVALSWNAAKLWLICHLPTVCAYSIWMYCSYTLYMHLGACLIRQGQRPKKQIQITKCSILSWCVWSIFSDFKLLVQTVCTVQIRKFHFVRKNEILLQWLCLT